MGKVLTEHMLYNVHLFRRCRPNLTFLRHDTGLPDSGLPTVYRVSGKS